MAVKIRLKKLGRTHRPFFRVCAMDARSPRDGRVIEELGTYDPMIGDTDARAVLKRERIDYWLGVGAQPSEKVATLIKKYGTNGTHVDAQTEALEKLERSRTRIVPDPSEVKVSKKKPAKKEEPAAAAAPAPAEEKPADEAPAAEAPAAEATATEGEKPTDDAASSES